MDWEAGIITIAGMISIILATYLPAFIPNVVIYFLFNIFGVIAFFVGIISKGFADTVLLLTCAFGLLFLGYMFFNPETKSSLGNVKYSLAEQYAIMHRQQKEKLKRYLEG